MKYKKIGACRILRKFSDNAYKVDLPMGMDILPIFNVADLHPYAKDKNLEGVGKSPKQTTEWAKNIPKRKCKEIDKMLQERIIKKTRGKEYKEYIVQWKRKGPEDNKWLSEAKLAHWRMAMSN